MRFPITILLTALVLTAGALPHLNAQAIKVALIKPWGLGVNGPVGPFWDDLSNNWSAYGSIPLVIDRTNFVQGTITAAALAQENPDVLLFSDCAGALATFTPQEQADIIAFLQSGGKRAVGSYITFQFLQTDNRWLLPHFGLDPGLSLTNLAHLSPLIDVAVPTSPFATSLPDPLPFPGYSQAQTPVDLSWDPADYSGVLIAASTNLRSIVHYFQAATHDAVYISFMPEYGGDALSRQLAFNAMTVPRPQVITITPLALPTIGTVLPLSLVATDFPNAPYVLGFSLSTTPGIPLSDSRIIPLNPDPLFWFAANLGNGVFLHTTGTLDGSGIANTWALVAIPPLPALVGTTVFTAMVTLDSSSATGVGGISAPLGLTITN